jgi:CheY-like chemotaxis protein
VELGAPADGFSRHAADGSGDGGEGVSSHTVLVADDDSGIRTVIGQALERAGYQVRVTGNAATLWRWISDGQGDVVVTDVVMPDENGLDLIPRIRKIRPETAGDRDECAEYAVDGGESHGARRIRVPAEAVRPQ